MIPYGHQKINQRDIDAVLQTLQSDWLTQGPMVRKFEDGLSEYCQTKYSVAFCNGTAALHAAYLALGLQAGDEVITTPNTFVATSNMLLAIGVKPVFVDIDRGTHNIDPQKIEKAITKKTKAIVPVHFAGQPCDMQKIKAIAKRHKLLVIEDACHALGAEYKDIKIGNCQYADMVIFSFHPVKSITTGEGGAILTDNKDYYEKLLTLRSHGIQKDANGFNVMNEFGYNYRMCDIQAALGWSQLQRLDSFIEKRRQRVAWYKQELKKQAVVDVSVERADMKSSCHLFVIRVKNKSDRLPLYKFLLKNDIGVNFHYPCVYLHPYYQRIGYGKIKLPEAEKYNDTCITLPLYTDLTKKDIRFICEKIKEYFN